MCVLLSVCTFLTFWINSCQNHFQPLFVLQFFCVFCWYLFSLRHHNPNLFNMLTQIYSEFLVHLIQLMLTGFAVSATFICTRKKNDNKKYSNRIAFNVNYFHLLANKEKKIAVLLNLSYFFVTTLDVIHTRLSTERLPNRVNWMHKFR